MKRIYLAIAIAMILAPAASAQEVKSVSAAKSAVESAKAAAENPKKNVKPATWVKYAQTLVDSYSSSVGNLWRGATETELNLVLAGVKPSSVKDVQLGGVTYSRRDFATSAIYVGGNGVVEAIEITHPVFENALETAIEAVGKGVAVDAKGQKTSDFSNLLATVQTKFTEEAIWWYTIGDKAKSSYCFEMAVKAAAAEPLKQVDTMCLYNAGITASESGDATKAKDFFQKCLESGYYSKDGDVYARLAAIALSEKDTVAGKNFLTEGFVKFPNSQVLCVNLINLYLKTGENPQQIFDLLGVAKNNDPKNASLYYVEGDIHKKLGNADEAIASYRKSQEVDPSFEWGFIGEAQVYMQLADEANKKAADEMDDAKYYKLIEVRDSNYLASLAPFEKAYEVTTDKAIKDTLADQLKSIYYVFSSKSDEYMEKYNKYNEIVKASKQ